MDTIGYRLRIARERSGFTLKAVAEPTGILIQSLSKYENDQCRPSYEDLKLIAMTLKHNPAWLAFGILPERTDAPDTDTALSRVEGARHFNASMAAHVIDCENAFYELEQSVTGANPHVETIRAKC